MKLRVCPACALKLNHRKEKQFRKAQVGCAATAAAAAAAVLRPVHVGLRLARRPLLPCLTGSSVTATQAQVLRDAAARGEPSGARGRSKRGRSEAREEDADEEGPEAGKEWVAPPPLKRQQQEQAAAAQAQQEEGQQASVLPADDSVWEARAPAQEQATLDEEFDTFFSGMFM